MSEIEFDCAVWRKSTRSDSGTMGDCVEVRGVGQAGGAGRTQGRAVGVRDSKNPDGPVLLFAPAEWSEFVARVKSGTCPPPPP